MATNSIPLEEMLRRAQLSRVLMSSQNGAPDEAGLNPPSAGKVASIPQGPQGPTAAPMASPMPVSGPPTVSPRDAALGAYRQAQQEPMPLQSDYHPSMGRRILGGVLGAIAGAHDPKSGVETARGIVNGPFDQKVAEYQAKLAQKRQAFEDEDKAELDSNKSKAEAARAGEEEEKRKGFAFTNSPEGFEQRKQLAAINHPNAPKENKMENVVLTLTNGKKVMASKGLDGVYKTPDGMGINPDLIDIDKGVHPLESPNPIVQPPHYDETRGGFVAPPNGDKPGSFSPVPGVTPKPVPTLEDEVNKAAAIAKATGNTGADKDRRAAISANAAGARQDKALAAKVDQPSPGAKARAETAEKILPHLDKIDGLIKDAEKSLGPLRGKWSEFMSGKLGAKDENFTALRSELKFLAAAVTQMHTGARGGATYLKEFNDLLSAGNQDPANLRQAIKATRSWATDYAHVGRGKKTEKEVDEKGSLDELLNK